MVEALQPVFDALLTPSCQKTFLVDHHFTDIACLKALISKVLGFGIILGAIIVKLPQIIKIVVNQNVASLSPSMYILENIGYLISFAYNFRHGHPFSTYGENFFLLLQGFILVWLVFHYGPGTSPAFWAGAAAFAGFSYALLSPTLTTFEQLGYLQNLSILIFAASKIPQIILIFKNGNSGQLAFLTVFMNAAGTGARIFTTIQEVNDSRILVGTLVSAVLNITILLQVLFYWNATNAAMKQQTNKKDTSKPVPTKSTTTTTGKDASKSAATTTETPTKRTSSNKKSKKAE